MGVFLQEQVFLKKKSDCPEPFSGEGDECMKKRKRQVGGFSTSVGAFGSFSF